MTTTSERNEFEAIDSLRIRDGGLDLTRAELVEAIVEPLSPRLTDLSPGELRQFVEQYFRHVEVADLHVPDLDSLIEGVFVHLLAGRVRPHGEAQITVFTPTTEKDGWNAGGSTLIQVITDDMPFLVDTTTMTLTQRGWSIREVLHPQFVVLRDDTGAFTDVLTEDEDHGHPGHGRLRESWIHIEAYPPLGLSLEEESAPLAEAIRAALDDVSAAVHDWERMRGRALETVSQLWSEMGTERDEQRHDAIEILRWLADDHFTFVGYCEFSVEGQQFTAVPGSGLGVLRGERVRADAFHAAPVNERSVGVMVITKDNARSSVHRPVLLDYVGVRRFAADGTIVGERRFLGLLAASAYTEAVRRIPVLAKKADDIIARSGYERDSHGAKVLREVIDTYPRDELFQAGVEELYPLIDQIAGLKERRQVRLFLRGGPWGRFLSCMVFLPRDRYDTTVRHRIEATLLDALDAESLEYQTRVSESVLARLFFIVRTRRPIQAAEVDVAALEQRLTKVVRAWDDDFVDLASELPSDQRGIEFPDAYREDNSALQGLLDLQALNALSDEQPLSLVMYVPPHGGAGRLKIFRLGGTLALTDVLPHITAVGLRVLDERPYEIALRGERAMVYDFGLQVPDGSEAIAEWSEDDRSRVAAAIGGSMAGASEPDGLSALVVRAGLSGTQVGWLRAVSRYLQQAGSVYSQPYIAAALTAHPHIAAALVELFEAKFEPGDVVADPVGREARVSEVLDDIDRALDDVASLDHDRIIGQFVAVLRACVRTNAFQPDVGALALKLTPQELGLLPKPRPAFEIFVHSPRVEGVHLRFGAVARGGLRWSDRPEDFRTEILGLVKAQTVKNTVIVPTGAKGGFFARQLPNPAVDRQAWLDEGVACYRMFITALLSVTDNIVDRAVVPPPHTVRYDADDPYLVVAADKGTATFSDIANAISIEQGFWLGDAFASGGSVGYDHKAMGITARGAWESVKRHFREMGVDCQAEDVTCIGIGDMAGDVFGNGMLLSRHIRLVGAFNHMHVFLDPNPDAEASFAERERLFRLPRSTWADYDSSLISEGGGVFERTLKSIPISPEVRTVLGLADDVSALTPAEVITAMLKAPVDLLWNGGIGTYVKATSENNADVGDRANDAVRVNGDQVRARCAGEGGNLGWTQLGRIEYALTGGRINTDFIDNSAGVDTSDHEVNIKILLAAEVAAGRLTMDERDALLPQMTDEVAALVLSHNIDQNTALANATSRALAMSGALEEWMSHLEQIGMLDRTVEFLPTTEEVRARIAAGHGLTTPELAVLLAYTKIWLKQEVLASDLPDDPYLADRLVQYFPALLRERYREAMQQHRLRREIITTVAINRFVNSQGISVLWRLMNESGQGGPDVIRAQLAARAIFGVGRLEVAMRHATSASAELQTRLRIELRHLVERGTRWILQNRRSPIDIGATVEEFTPGVEELVAALPDALVGRLRATADKRIAELTDQGVEPGLARVFASIPVLQHAPVIVAVALRVGRGVVGVAETFFEVAEKVGLDLLLTRIEALPRMTKWEAMARGALREDLMRLLGDLVEAVLEQAEPDEPVSASVDRWLASVPQAEQRMQSVADIVEDDPDLAKASVGLRQVRSMLG